MTQQEKRTYRVINPIEINGRTVDVAHQCPHEHRTISGAARCLDARDSGLVGTPRWEIVRGDFSPLGGIERDALQAIWERQAEEA